MLTYFAQSNNTALILGLSSDTKPTALSTMTFIETDTGKIYREVSGAWVCSSDITYASVSKLGYAINVQALTSSPVDAQTVYFGSNPKAPTTTAAINKIYIRKAGTIKTAEIYCHSGTAGTSESWSLYIRKNNSADTLIATIAAATNERVFTNNTLSISVSPGDYLEIKGIQPTWATNPLTTTYGGYIYIE